MKITFENEERKSSFNKLIRGLIEGNDVSWFAIDKEEESVSLLFGDWNVKMKNDGTWEIG